MRTVFVAPAVSHPSEAVPDVVGEARSVRTIPSTQGGIAGARSRALRVAAGSLGSDSSTPGWSRALWGDLRFFLRFFIL